MKPGGSFVGFVGFVGFIVPAVLGEARKLPSFVQLCSRSSPAFDACLLNTVEALRPSLVNGIPLMRLPALEPFVLPGVVINQDVDALSVRLRVKNIRAFGGSQFVVDSLVTDLANLRVATTVRLPALSAEAGYDINGRIMLIPLKGKGIFRSNFTDIRAEVGGQGQVTVVDGVRRLSVTQVTARIRVAGNVDVAFLNHQASPRNPAIANSVASFFNQNQQLVFDILYPVLDETAQAIIAKMAAAFLDNLDFDQILPV